MKDYRSYMDRVNVSEETHEKLLGLEAEKKEEKTMKRKPYIAIAAAVCAVLLVGVGVWRVGTRQDPERWRDQAATFEPSVIVESAPLSDPEPVQCAAPSSPAEAIDLAPEDPSGAEPGAEAIEGYETRDYQGGQEVVTYYCLPGIDYGGGNNAATAALDWDIPAGAARRDLAGSEITALLGGQDAVDLHLDWGAYELSGWGAWYEDGSFWGAYLQGYNGPMDHFEFAITAGALPPTCVVFGDSVEQEIWGLTVTADKYDSEDGCARRVSFMKDGYGYRFDLTATGEPEEAERLVSRAVAWVCQNGLSLRTVTGEETPAMDQPETSSQDGASSPSWNPNGVEDLTPEGQPACNSGSAPRPFVRRL